MEEEAHTAQEEYVKLHPDSNPRLGLKQGPLNCEVTMLRHMLHYRATFFAKQYLENIYKAVKISLCHKTIIPDVTVYVEKKKRKRYVKHIYENYSYSVGNIKP